VPSASLGIRHIGMLELWVICHRELQSNLRSISVQPPNARAPWQMYEQVAASRNRMAQQLSAANRHVTFLETALESRRGEVAAAMASMQALTQVSGLGLRSGLGLGLGCLKTNRLSPLALS